MNLPNLSEPSLIPALQADALAHEIERQLQEERKALITTAQSDARATVAQARATARRRLRDAIAELRREGERRLTRARAELETSARSQQQKQASRALEAALPLLHDALAASWRDNEARKIWAENAAKLCVTRLRHGDFTVEHPASWTARDQKEFRAAIADNNGIAITFTLDQNLEAGLRIKADQAVLDATVRGLLSDTRTIAALLLDELDHGTDK